jgi:ABC-type transporter Mla maintaining outer membrane lipid asymmetry permease subunit MlaE
VVGGGGKGLIGLILGVFGLKGVFLGFLRVGVFAFLGAWVSCWEGFEAERNRV